MHSSFSARPRWWQWPTILSLDAPLVCVVWQGLLARTSGAGLRWPHAAVLATSVWLAYAADRWIEGWRLDSRVVRTQRHLFYQRQRVVVAAVWLCVLAADVTMAGMTMEAKEIGRGLLLVAPVLVYLLSHQLLHRTHEWRAPKELVVALLLTAGVAVFLWPVLSVSTLVRGLGAFATVSFINCALISAWEREVDRAHGQTSLALESARVARVIRWLPWLAAVGGAAVMAAPAGAFAAPIACGIFSAILMGLIDRIEHRLGWAAARVLADAALLTPIVPLFWAA
ncbi:MAG: hypothetical protein ABI634_02300 [Acidobacteriota bacterium]